MRRMSYQQFPYQLGMKSCDISRQHVIYDSNSSGLKLADEFFARTELTIREFTHLSLALITHAQLEKENHFTESYFKILVKGSEDKAKVRRFLELLTLDAGEIRERDKLKLHESSYYAPSPLFKHPLIKTKPAIAHQQTYHYLHKNHVFEAVKCFIFDYLRKPDANKFMGHFGKCFSDYIEKLIEHSRSKYFDENKLLRLVPKGTRIVDFAILEKEALILIEAKGIEASPAVQSTASPEILGSRLRDSILKALKQGIESANNLSHIESFERQKNYIIVTTYKEMYLSTGSIIRSCIGSTAGGEIQALLHPSRLDWDDIFVMSVDSFERLSEEVRSKRTNFTSFLSKVKENQEDPKAVKFTFSQILAQERYLKSPNFIDTTWDEIMTQVIRKMKP